jgi:arginase
MASDPVAGIDLVGVRFDGMGRSPGQAGAPQALRAAGLQTALPAAELTSDVILPAPTSARGPAGFINEPALLVMVDTVYSRVGHSLRTGRFPLLYGADCAVLLAAIPALRDTAGRAGLLFVDAHEDATTMEQSDTGEAASMEIALLLGLTGTYAPEPLRSRLPALDRDTIVMLGQRDHLYRWQIGVRPGSAAPSRGAAR